VLDVHNPTPNQNQTASLDNRISSRPSFPLPHRGPATIRAAAALHALLLAAARRHGPATEACSQLPCPPPRPCTRGEACPEPPCAGGHLGSRADAVESPWSTAGSSASEVRRIPRAPARDLRPWPAVRHPPAAVTSRAWWVAPVSCQIAPAGITRCCELLSSFNQPQFFSMYLLPIIYSSSS
jgi:hypothetical protein